MCVKVNRERRMRDVNYICETFKNVLKSIILWVFSNLNSFRGESRPIFYLSCITQIERTSDVIRPLDSVILPSPRVGLICLNFAPQSRANKERRRLEKDKHRSFCGHRKYVWMRNIGFVRRSYNEC